VGKLFHSGLPHKGINSIEMAMDAVNYIQKHFYEDFPQHPKEIEYKFLTSSTMKPTQIKCSTGSLNQICPTCTVEGDIRVTPFYDVKDVAKAVESYVEKINNDPDVLLSHPHTSSHGPFSKYTLPAPADGNGAGQKGKVNLKWLTEGENGVACDITSAGFAALAQATFEVLGEVKPYSISGSLPLIRELKDEGFDVQISGYGSSSHYHADNECVSLKALTEAFKIFVKLVCVLESK